MTIAVDTNVVVSAAFWPKSEDRRCFVALARRRCRLAVTETILHPPLFASACQGRSPYDEFFAQPGLVV